MQRFYGDIEVTRGAAISLCLLMQHLVSGALAAPPTSVSTLPCHSLIESSGTLSAGQTQEIRALLQRVALQIENGNLDQVPPGVFGRILRGRTQKDFQSFSPDKGRRIVMLMDHEGIKEIFHRSNTRSPLDLIGYPRHLVQSLTAEGTLFRLVLVYKPHGARIASWSNLHRILQDAYGVQSLPARLFEIHRMSLKSLSFDQIFQNGSIPVRSSNDLSESSDLQEFRAFLYHELKLNELYTGQGWTLQPSGEMGLNEYFVLNQEIGLTGSQPAVLIDVLK